MRSPLVTRSELRSIGALVAHVVVALDVIEADRRRDSRHLEQFAHVARKVLKFADFGQLELPILT